MWERHILASPFAVAFSAGVRLGQTGESFGAAICDAVCVLPSPKRVPGVFDTAMSSDSGELQPGGLGVHQIELAFGTKERMASSAWSDFNLLGSAAKPRRVRRPRAAACEESAPASNPASTPESPAAASATTPAAAPAPEAAPAAALAIQVAVPPASPAPTVVSAAASAAAPAASAATISAVPQPSAKSDDRWTAADWLAALGVGQQLGEALLSGTTSSNDELAAMRTLESSLASAGALVEHLRQAQFLEKLADRLLPALRQLSTAKAVTGSELHSKFVSEGNSFTLKYGDLNTFFSGLEGKIGVPSPNIFAAMERDHTKAVDSLTRFTTGNYWVTTTPEVEWKFVVEPERQASWPTEEISGMHPSKMRSPLPLDEVRRRVDVVNQRLQAQREPGLMLEEGYGARLYTGPMVR